MFDFLLGVFNVELLMSVNNVVGSGVDWYEYYEKFICEDIRVMLVLYDWEYGVGFCLMMLLCEFVFVVFLFVSINFFSLRVFFCLLF